MPSTPARGPAVRNERAGDRWNGLQTLIRVRLLVATVALPLGVLLRPDATASSRWMMGWMLLSVGVASALFGLFMRLRRGLAVQTYLQVAFDLAFVAALCAVTGARESQFVPFLAMVVISGGLLARLPGGLFAAAGACIAFLSLRASPESAVSAVPSTGMLMAFLGVMGVLAGVLGERARRTREVLWQTARELDRVRVDNDVILRHLATGVFTADAAGRVAYLNPAGEQTLGLQAADVMGRPLAEAVPERLGTLREAMLEALRLGTGRSRVEHMVGNETGRMLPIGVSTNLLMHEGAVTGVVAVFSDLTEVREMERRARRNETLAEVGALAAGIAHELRNGLTPISGSVECLQRELSLEGENAVLMKLIVTECGRLHRFVSDLLNYAREREPIVEPLPVDEHLADLVEMIRRDPRCGPGIEVRFEPQDAAVAVEADREQIRQVWLNLAANALEAMEGAGTLTLAWSSGEKSEVIVEFADTGAGIRPEDLAQVGQPFFTTKARGTGLGLAIAQRIVERHGGTLLLESRPGSGTTVRVTLPARAIPVARAA